VHLPLFKVEFPVYPKMLVESMITIATFDILPTDDIFAAMWIIPDEEEAASEYNDVGYESHFTIINLGMIFLVIMVFFFMLFLLLVTLPCKNKIKRVRQWHEKWSKSLFWNGIIRFFIEGSLELVIVVSITCTQVINDYRTKENFLPEEGRFFFLCDLITCFIFALLCIVFPIFVYIFYSRRYHLWEDEEFEETYGAPLEGLHRENYSALGYPMIFLIRRYMFTLLIVLVPDFLWM